MEPRLPRNRKERRQRGHRGPVPTESGELMVHAVRFSIDIMVSTRMGEANADMLARKELAKQLERGNLRQKMFGSVILVPGGIQATDRKLEPVTGHLRSAK